MRLFSLTAAPKSLSDSFLLVSPDLLVPSAELSWSLLLLVVLGLFPSLLADDSLSSSLAPSLYGSLCRRLVLTLMPT
jgi:hypothetical protein